MFLHHQSASLFPQPYLKHLRPALLTKSSMKIGPAFVLVLLLLCSIPLTEGTFSNRRSSRLIAAIRRTPLGRRNARDIRRSVNVLRLRFPNCRPEVCFALDGSSSISPQQYRLQTNFAQLVTAVLGGLSGSSFAANQYGGIVQIISARTTALLGRRGILARLSRSTRAGSPITFIAPGLQFCVSQFSGRAQVTNAKIVLLGDGRTTFAPDLGRFGAVSIATSFLNDDDKNGICGVLVGGNNSNRALFRRIVGRGGTLVQPPSWNGVGQSLVRVVTEACS
eukprot:GFKZ01010776.1.p1 GENE.GFKZ01010776.1~~GFKZ01010776.1.p1  ORF type:complete len:279 (-),score=10.73 GFKZ01010776.1:533-1369(-)